MPTGVKIEGLDRVMSKLRAGELNRNHALEAAAKASLNVVKTNARLLLT